MGIIEDILYKVKTIYTKVTSTIPRTIRNLKSTTTSIKNTVSSLPSKIQKIPSSIGTIVSDKVGSLKEGFDDTIDKIKDMPKTVIDGIEDGLTKPDGLLDRAGLVDDNGELRDFSNLKEGAVNTTNAKMLQIGDGMKNIADKVEDGIDTAVRAGTAGLTLAAKTAGNFIKDNTKEGLKLARDFSKNFIENQLESTGVGPFMKDNWQKIGIGASAVGGAYLFSLAGVPVLTTKMTVGSQIRSRKIYNRMGEMKKQMEHLAL